jgi:hypothetical protein
MEINRYHVKTTTEIITTTLGIPEDYKQQCIQEAYKIGDKQGKKTNVKAIMSSYHIWEETKTFNPLSEKIVEQIYKIVPIDPRFKYNLHTMWSAIYKEGHHTVPHGHLPAIISFVYYLKAQGNSSPLIFNDASFLIHPYDDLLVIFPGNLTHSVPEHSGEDRICIAGNLEWVDNTSPQNLRWN